jgi:hypothetical protein
MQLYEIRVLRRDKSTATVIEVMHLNDHAAIRAAARTAGTQPFEVWRGLDCIYGEGHMAPPPEAPEPRPAA